MAKTIVKELVISLLLCLAIILLLGILLYEYVPMTKTIPNPVSYSTPNEVKKELADSSDIDESQIIMTYEVDANDLNNYTSIQDYKPGKANPFSSYETTTTGTTTNGTGTTTANSSTSNGQTGDNQIQSNNTTTNNVDPNSGTSSTPSSNSQPTTESPQSTTTQQPSTTSEGGHFCQDKGTK